MAPRRHGAGGGGASGLALRSLRREVQDLRDALAEIMLWVRNALGQKPLEEAEAALQSRAARRRSVRSAKPGHAGAPKGGTGDAGVAVSGGGGAKGREQPAGGAAGAAGLGGGLLSQFTKSD